MILELGQYWFFDDTEPLPLPLQAYYQYVKMEFDSRYKYDQTTMHIWQCGPQKGRICWDLDKLIK